MPTLDVFWSGAGPQSRLHLDPRCTGLERTIVHPREHQRLKRTTVPSLVALAKVSAGSQTSTLTKLKRVVGPNAGLLPCRACALEAVLDSVMGTGSTTGPFLTFSALPSDVADAHRYVMKDLTESATARLERIAHRAGLSVTGSRLGPVAFGRVARAAVEVVTANLRALPASATPKSASQVSIVWSLVDDGFGGGAAMGDYDPWDVASRV